VAAEFDVPVDT